MQAVQKVTCPLTVPGPTHSRSPQHVALAWTAQWGWGHWGPRVGTRPPSVHGLDEGQIRACLELGSVTELGLS